MTKMYLSSDEKIVITYHGTKKKYSSRKLFREFPDKGVTRSGLNKLLTNIESTGFADCINGSGQPKLGGNEKSIVAVNEVILSQEDEPGSHQTY